MAAITAGGHEFFVAFVSDLGETRIGVFQFALGGAFGCRRRRCGFTASCRRALLRGAFWLLRRVISGERWVSGKAKAEDCEIANDRSSMGAFLLKVLLSAEPATTPSLSPLNAPANYHRATGSAE